MNFEIMNQSSRKCESIGKKFMTQLLTLTKEKINLDRLMSAVIDDLLV